MIDDRQLATVLIIAFGNGGFVDLCPVLVGGKAQFECARVEILVNTSAVIPAFTGVAADGQVKLLFAEMVCIIV